MFASVCDRFSSAAISRSAEINLNFAQVRRIRRQTAVVLSRSCTLVGCYGPGCPMGCPRLKLAFKEIRDGSRGVMVPLPHLPVLPY